MTPVEWAIVISLFAQFLVSLTISLRIRDGIMGWARELFAKRTGLAVVETEIRSIKEDIAESKVLLIRIIDKLDTNHNERH